MYCSSLQLRALHCLTDETCQWHGNGTHLRQLINSLQLLRRIIFSLSYYSAASWSCTTAWDIHCWATTGVPTTCFKELLLCFCNLFYNLQLHAVHRSLQSWESYRVYDLFMLWEGAHYASKTKWLHMHNNDVWILNYNVRTLWIMVKPYCFNCKHRTSICFIVELEICQDLSKKSNYICQLVSVALVTGLDAKCIAVEKVLKTGQKYLHLYFYSKIPSY